ncbi:uncharacterized protein LOC131537569 isoform X2 [Onychostoma macrolepis]|uniref:uncharacterized protein LOC131537569 isoform X2 n=1 Tax=Onychostoma macrolepis TaxID=369639 RepID=UPI00272D502C|nr:uncharacterized protein LOC131537569 isoform X2 [Onychostoma macrolepis]
MKNRHMNLNNGTSGAEVTHVFFSSGENVRLSCNNALSGCSSTTWTYDRHSAAVELIAGGIKRTDRERHERLSLDSDCSLNIKNVTKEDRGPYSCRQYVNGVQQGTDARVYLHVLHVSSSSSQSEIRSGRSVTLSCQLYNDRDSCDTVVRSEGIELIWVNQAGVNLQTDSRFQIFSSEQCLSSLTTTLLNEDHNREWRCQVTQRNQLKTSATYTVKYSAPTETKTPSPVTSSTSAAAPTEPVTQITPNPSATTQQVIGIVVAAALAVLITAAILWVVRKKRTDNRKGTYDSVEQKDEVTYTEVATHCKIQKAKKNEVHGEDKVTYSSIR